MLTRAYEKHRHLPFVWERIRFSALPHRSTASIRNRWKRMMHSTTVSLRRRYRCRLCGAFRRGHTCVAARALSTTPPDAWRSILSATDMETMRMLSNVQEYMVAQQERGAWDHALPL